MKEYKSAAYTLMGRRTRNQDNFLLNGQILDAKHGNDTASASGLLDGPVFVAVVDGCGTKTTGETASRLVCEHLWSVHERFEEVNQLEDVAPIINEALLNANKDIESVMLDEPTSKMGATAAVLLIYNGRAIFGNVGDSAVYLRRDGTMQKLTCDHTEGEELIARGALTRDMLKNHSSKFKVTRKIGYMSFDQTDIMQFYDVIDVKDGDVFVLASPGIVQFMSPDDINEGLQSCIDISKSAERVAKSALNDFGSKDNITALAVKIHEQVDNVGNKNAKVKPIRSSNVHVHTSLNIDREDVIKLIYVFTIILILAIAIIYVIKAYPRPDKLKHVNQNGYSWSAPPSDGSTVSSDNDTYEKSSPTPLETLKPSPKPSSKPTAAASASGTASDDTDSGNGNQP